MGTFDVAELRRLDQATHLHPFTDHRSMHREGTHIIRSARGCFVVDETGRQLLDGLAGLWCVNVGYGRTEIVDAVRAQMETLAYYPSFFNSTTEPTIRLAAKLAALAPPRLGHTIFSNSGSEANETALKLIRAYWKLKQEPARRKIVSRTFAYHGVGIATTSLTGLPTCTDPFDLPLPDFVRVPGPNVHASGTGMTLEEYGRWCLDETAKTFARAGASTIAAFFAEPIQGAGGVIVPPPGHVRALRDLCRQHDILFVADEVITGFGRLGGWFASSLWDLEPDFITVAKGITSGYLPLGGTLVSDEITGVLHEGGYLAHGFTYSGHPVAAAAALANIDIIERERLCERVRDDLGPRFQQRLEQLSAHPGVAETRGDGLIGALELKRPAAGPLAAAPPNTLGVAAAAIAREEGVIVRGIRDLIALAPPLVITHAELDQLFGAVERTLDRLR